MAEYTNYAITQYKMQEQQDDGISSPSSPMGNQSTSPLGNTQRLASLAVAGYVGSKIYSTVTSNVKNLTGSTRTQQRVDTATFLIGSLTAAIATKGLSLVYQGVDIGVDFAVRNKVNQIENEARAEERKFLGKHITNSMGAAYYD
jgi:hypothetical protein